MPVAPSAELSAGEVSYAKPQLRPKTVQGAERSLAAVEFALVLEKVAAPVPILATIPVLEPPSAPDAMAAALPMAGSDPVQAAADPLPAAAPITPSFQLPESVSDPKPDAPQPDLMTPDVTSELLFMSQAQPLEVPPDPGHRQPDWSAVPAMSARIPVTYGPVATGPTATGPVTAGQLRSPAAVTLPDLHPQAARSDPPDPPVKVYSPTRFAAQTDNPEDLAPAETTVANRAANTLPLNTAAPMLQQAPQVAATDTPALPTPLPQRPPVAARPGPGPDPIGAAPRLFAPTTSGPIVAAPTARIAQNAPANVSPQIPAATPVGADVLMQFSATDQSPVTQPVTSRTAHPSYAQERASAYAAFGATPRAPNAGAVQATEPSPAPVRAGPAGRPDAVIRQPAALSDAPPQRSAPRPAAARLLSLHSLGPATDPTPAQLMRPDLHPADSGLRPVDTTPTQGARTMAAHVAAQVAGAAQVQPNGTTDVTLNPKELGQVRLTLQTTDTTISILIIAERPETAELMRRHIDTLAQEFRSLGYQDISVSFGGRHGGPGGQGGQGDAPPHHRFSHGAEGANSDAPPSLVNVPADRYLPRRAAAQNSGAGLDLRL